MNIGGVVGLFVLTIVVAIMAFLFGVAIISWNVNDIIQHGPNFWNIFWLSLVAVVWFGGGRSVTK